MAFVVLFRVITLSLAVHIYPFIHHDLGFMNIIEHKVFDTRGHNGNFFSQWLECTDVIRAYSE